MKSGRVTEEQITVSLRDAEKTLVAGTAKKTWLAERAERGAQYERIVAGTHGQSRMFWASCRALARYFFERARPVCEQAIGSVRVTGL